MMLQRAIFCKTRVFDGAVHLKTGLWVERYAPKGFLDLLSDEAINREVVRWLKSWDTCVFRGEANKDARKSAPGRGSFKGTLRPEHKVLLLCGAPGMLPLVNCLTLPFASCASLELTADFIAKLFFSWSLVSPLLLQSFSGVQQHCRLYFPCMQEGLGKPNLLWISCELLRDRPSGATARKRVWRS